MKRVSALLLLFLFLPVSSLADLQVHFLNVGQGDCTVVLCDGESMVIDGGPRSASGYVYIVIYSGNAAIPFNLLNKRHELFFTFRESHGMVSGPDRQGEIVQSRKEFHCFMQAPAEMPAQGFDDFHFVFPGRI